jgi:hypothetical protein
MSQTSKVRSDVRTLIIEAVSKSESGMTTEDLSLTTGLKSKTTREAALKLFNAGELVREKRHSHLLGMRVWHYRVPESMQSLPLPTEPTRGLADAVAAGSR